MAIHFPKGEGIKIIKQRSEASVNDSIYILPIDETNAEMIIVSKSGKKRSISVGIPVDLSDYIKKPTTTISSPDTTWKWVAILDDSGNSVRMLAGDLGRNIANSSLTSISGAGMTLGASYTWNTAGQFFYLSGLPDKSSDPTFKRMIMEDSNSQLAYVDDKTWFINLPYRMTLAERNNWITAMNQDVANSYLQLITVIDGNFISGQTDFIITIYGLNINALNGLTQVTFELVGPDGNPVPSNMFDVTSYSVNSNSELAVHFEFDPSYAFMTGEYTLRVIRQLVVLGEVGITAYNSFVDQIIPNYEFNITNNGMDSAAYTGGTFSVTASAESNAIMKSINPLSPTIDYDITYNISSTFVGAQLGAGSQSRYITFRTGFSVGTGTLVSVGASTELTYIQLGLIRGGGFRIMSGASSSMGYIVESSGGAAQTIALKITIQKRSNRYKLIIYRQDNNALLYAGTYTNSTGDNIFFYTQFLKSGYPVAISNTLTGLTRRTYS